MQARPVQRNSCRVSASSKTTGELVKLVRKLRWVGMQEEAEELENELQRRQAAEADSVIASSAETD